VQLAPAVRGVVGAALLESEPLLARADAQGDFELDRHVVAVRAARRLERDGGDDLDLAARLERRRDRRAERARPGVADLGDGPRALERPGRGGGIGKGCERALDVHADRHGLRDRRRRRRFVAAAGHGERERGEGEQARSGT
jgi:hypothetical protein